MATSQKIDIIDLPINTRGQLSENCIPTSFLNANQLAQTLSVSVHTVRSWKKFKTIPYHKFGRSIRFNLEQVLEALEERNFK